MLLKLFQSLDKQSRVSLRLTECYRKACVDWMNNICQLSVAFSHHRWADNYALGLLGSQGLVGSLGVDGVAPAHTTHHCLDWPIVTIATIA